MDKKQVTLTARIKVLSVALFLLSGCLTTESRMATVSAPSKKVLDDVLVFRDLQEIDLDKDGEKEIVAIYVTNTYSSGVAVVKFDNDKGRVIFERTFNTPNIKFEIIKGIPTIILDEKAEYSTLRRFKYFWDGEAFTFERK